MCENTISIINSKQYGELIHDLFLRSRLIDVGTNLINDSYITNDENKSFKLIEKTEQNLFNLIQNNDPSKGPQNFEEIMHSTLAYAEKAYK